MGKLEEFLVLAQKHANSEGIVNISDLSLLFPERSSSYANVKMSSLKDRGLVERVSPGKWRILSFPIFSGEENGNKGEAKISCTEPEGRDQQLETLVLTPEEKTILDFLIDVQTKCPEKGGDPRFTQSGLDEVLEKQGISDLEWKGLEKKLLSLRIINKVGIGKGGQIFDLNQDLLLKYLTDEDLVKITLWREEHVRERLKTKIDNLKTRAVQINNLQEEIQKNLRDLELARERAKILECNISNLQKRLRVEFPDKEEVLNFQDLLKGIEHLGEKAMLSFFKEILE